MLNINKCRHRNNQMNDQWITITIKYYNFYGTKIPLRGGEWYLEKRGSQKILAGSLNLGSVFDKSALGLEVLSLHGLFLLFMSLETFYQRVSARIF